jgi:hypothetical protein
MPLALSPSQQDPSFIAKTLPNFALELTRGPFVGTGETNCTASRRLHVAPFEGLVSRGSQRAA